MIVSDKKIVFIGFILFLTILAWLVYRFCSGVFGFPYGSASLDLLIGCSLFILAGAMIVILCINKNFLYSLILGGVYVGTFTNLYTLNIFLEKQLIPVLGSLKQSTSPDYFETCKSHAVIIEGGRVGLCQNLKVGQLKYSIIYDSSGEILKKPDMRRVDWYESVKESGELNGGRYAVYKLEDGFYIRISSI